jgi:serine protease Do
MTQLIDGGTVRRGMLGVTIQPVTSDIARSLGLETVRGALVNGVQPDSPASRAGLERGDVITRVNGEDVRDFNELRNRVAQVAPGTKLPLDVIRGGKPRSMTVVVGELKQAAEEAARPEQGETAPDTTGFGMGVQPVTPEQARELDLPANRGVLVASVSPDGKAAAAGLREGDVIEEVDGTPVTSVDTLRAALKKGDKPALLLVHRQQQSVFVTMERAG